MGLYQVKRKFSCIVRAEFAEFCRLRIPVLPDWLRPGLFNTLKKSALKRSRTCSLMGMVLKMEASRPNVPGPATY